MLDPYPAFQPGQSTIFFGGVNATAATPNNGDVDRPHQDLEHSQRYETFWGQAIVEWEIPKHVIKLNGNYQYFDYATDLDYDYTDLDAQELILKTKNKTWSGEATIRSEYEGRFDWLFGANYQKDNAPATDIPIWFRQAGQELQNFAVFDSFTLSAFSTDALNVCAGPCIFTQDDPNRPEIQYDTDTDTDTLGVFLQGGIDFTEKFRFDAGVRYSWTSRKIEDHGYLDILLEPYDVVTDPNPATGDPGFCATLAAAVPALGFLAAPFFAPKENCFEFGIAPFILQPQVGAAGPLNASNVAFLLPVKGDLDAATLNTAPVVKDKEWDSITGRARFEYRPTDGQLFYIGYSRGERHGGFNFFSVPPFKSETINAYEIGAKNTLFDNRLQLNSTFFYYDFENRFINETVNNVVTTVNAPQSQIYGVELSWIYAPVDRLLLSGNFGYLHAEITEDFLSQDNTVSASNPNSFCPNKVYPSTFGSAFAGLPAVGDRHGYGPTCVARFRT
jgi:outer membrane receptor protein involved in Fe transport